MKSSRCHFVTDHAVLKLCLTFIKLRLIDYVTKQETLFNLKNMNNMYKWHLNVKFSPKALTDSSADLNQSTAGTLFLAKNTTIPCGELFPIESGVGCYDHPGSEAPHLPRPQPQGWKNIQPCGKKTRSTCCFVNYINFSSTIGCTCCTLEAYIIYMK